MCANANQNLICSHDLVETNTIPSSYAGMREKLTPLMGKIAMVPLLRGWGEGGEAHPDKMFLFITWNKLLLDTSIFLMTYPADPSTKEFIFIIITDGKQ